MDRVTQLAEEARKLVETEIYAEAWVSADAARSATRECLADLARELGFPELEISAAIDTALGGR